MDGIFQKLSNTKIQHCTHLLHFMYLFHHEDGMQTKFSICGRMFVCQHKMVRDCEPVIQLAHHKLPGGHGEDMLPKSYYKLPCDFLEGTPSHLVLATEKKLRKVSIKPMQNLHNNVQY